MGPAPARPGAALEKGTFGSILSGREAAMHPGKRAWLLGALLAAARVASFGKDPAPSAPAVPPVREQVSKLMKAEKYTEALPLIEGELKKSGGSLDWTLDKIDALLGLYRYSEAAKAALDGMAKFPSEPVFRFKAGMVAFHMGSMAQAVQILTPLYDCPDETWAGQAYRRAAIAQTAAGKEDLAKSLLDAALAKLEDPPEALLTYALALERDPSRASAILDRLVAADPTSGQEYRDLKGLYASAGSAGLMEESPLKGVPAVLPLKERSDERVGVRSESRVVLPVSLNGTKANWMLVDSGADAVLITHVAAKALDLRPVTSAEYVGLGYKGPRPSAWVMLKTLQIGDFTLSNVPAMLMDKDTDYWKEMGGIVPLSLFKRHAVLFDRRHGRLSLYPSGTKPEAAMPAGCFRVKSLWFRGKPFVEVVVKDGPPGYALLDTGSTITILAAEMSPLTGVRPNSGKYSGQYASGLSGGLTTGVAQKVSLGLGTFRIEMPTAMVKGLAGLSEIDCQALLGRDLLDHFLMFFDYQANVVAFKAYDK